MAKIAGIEIEEHAKNMFRAGSDFQNKTTEEIFYQDFKVFHTNVCDFGVARISAMSREELDKLRAATAVPKKGAGGEEAFHGLCHADGYFGGVLQGHFCRRRGGQTAGACV